MRRLLSKQTNKSFSILRKIIVTKTKEIKDYESVRGIEFQKHLKQLMLDQKTRSAKTKSFKNLYDKICLTAPKPIETLLNQFLQHSKAYDEDDLVQTTQYMAKAFQISLNDHGGHLDRFDYKLIESPMFDHFIQQVKYALSDKSHTDIPNVIKILNSLGQMNYLDIEIIKLVMVKIEKILNLSKEQSIAFQSRAYQSQKKDYYKSNIIGLDKDLLQSQIFQKNLAYFEQKKKQYAQKLAFTNIQQESFETKENYQTVVSLLNQFEKFNKGTERFIEGIIAVRQQYKKLVTISANQKVMRNPELNSAALILEEKLLQMRLITIQDVKNPEAISDEAKELQKVEQTVKLLMSIAQIDNFEDYFVSEDKNLEYLNQMKQKELSNFSALLEALAQYSNLPFKLQGTDNKVSLLNVKWQRYFLENKFKENNLDVERMFRRAFMETHKFISNNLSTLQLSFIEGTFQSKVRWYSTLIQLGLLEEVSNELRGAKISVNEIKKLNDKQFLAYLKILNNLYQNQNNPFQHNLSHVQSRLSSILDGSDFNLSINELCESINYLYQALGGKQSEVYRRLVRRLSQQVRYIERSPTTNKQLTKQAKRILLFEDPETDKQTTSLLSLFEMENHQGSKSNPYLKAVYDALIVNSANLGTPYIPTGINENNQLSGIYLVNSNSSSVKGNEVSGNVHAYCLRLYHKFGVKVTPISINKLLNITTVKQMDSTDKFIIKMKTSDQIIQVLSHSMPKNTQAMTQFLREVGSYLICISESSNNNFKIKKLLRRLSRLGSLYKSQKDILMINQFYARRCQVLVQLNLLKRDLNLLTEEQVNEAHTKLYKNQQSKSLKLILSRIEAQLEKPLKKIQTKLNEIEENIKKKGHTAFDGKRISLNLLKEQVNTPEWEGFEIQLLNTAYISDYRFVEYKDWDRKLKQSINYNEIKLSNASELTKLLVMRFCPQVKQTIVALPSRDGQFYVPYYPLDWESKYYYYPEGKAEKEYIEQISQGYRSLHTEGSKKEDTDITLIALQRFKHELKLMGVKDIVEKILGLEALDNLMITKLSGQSEDKGQGKFLQRDAQQYFSYLERKSDKMYLESPYLQYIFNKIQQSENMKDKVKERKESKIKLKMLYDQGVIDKKQYFENLKQVDNKLIDQLKSLKRKVLSHVEGVQILEDASKIVQLTQNIDDLSRIVSSAEFYDRNEDTDLALVGGDYQKALQIKRSKAETNLIIFRILALKAQKKQITKEQEQFLAKWKESVKNGITSLSFNNSFTRQSVSQFLTANDKSRLSLKSNSLMICSELAASDLLLEFGLFLDEAVLQQLQSQIYAQFFSSKYNVPASIFETSWNKRFKNLAHQAEVAIFEENSHLNKKQIDCLIEMSRIFKTQGISDRQKYNLHYRNFREKLELINKCRYRSPLAIEYLKQKDYEYYRSYLPEDVADMKAREVSNLWKKIFLKEINKTNWSQIRAKVNEICQRMLFIKLNTPPYFGNLVLQILRHENTDVFTKQKLIAYIELFKVPLQLDSADLESLIETEDLKLDEIMDGMRKISNENFSKSLHAIL